MSATNRHSTRVRAPMAALQPLHRRRAVVIAATLSAMTAAAVLVWLVLGAMPGIAKSLPIERVVFVSAAAAPLTEVSGEALKRVADALRTRGASMLQLDLTGLAANVKQVPWVREATIRRQFPATIVVAIDEHRALARWMAETRDANVEADAPTTLVNSYGDVFTAVIADERRDLLPQLAGPDGTSAEVLTRYAALIAPLAAIERTPIELVLTARRAWQLRLDNGTTVELGRADTDARIARFIRTYPALAPLQVAGAIVDMRYQTGFTIRNALAATAPNRKKSST